MRTPGGAASTSTLGKYPDERPVNTMPRLWLWKLPVSRIASMTVTAGCSVRRSYSVRESVTCAVGVEVGTVAVAAGVAARGGGAAPAWVAQSSSSHNKAGLSENCAQAREILHGGIEADTMGSSCCRRSIDHMLAGGSTCGQPSVVDVGGCWRHQEREIGRGSCSTDKLGLSVERERQAAAE